MERMELIRMGARIARKRVAENKRVAKQNGFLFVIPRRLLVIPPAILLITLFFFLFSSTLFTVSFFHVCISSRKLNLYCVSSGSKPNVLESFRVEAEDNNSSGNNNSSKEAEVFAAIRDAENQIRTLRKLSSSISDVSKEESCQGRGIFVYDLPTRFNKEIVDNCANWVPWKNFCEFMHNDAMGEVISKLGSNWYRTHQYSLEPIFHSRISIHPCRVYDPEMAKLFYVPFYGGLDVLRWHFKNVSNEIKDGLGLDLLRWLGNQKSWIRNAGKDHVFVLGKISWDFRRENSSWGSNLLVLPQMQNPIKLLIERQPWHLNDIGVPHPTHFHPRSDQEILDWQSKIFSSERVNLVSFAGAARPESLENIRSVLIKQCTESAGFCQFLDCNSSKCGVPETVIELFAESEFCLQPPGDSPTRKSVFDSLVSCCIPVMFDPFTAYYQYPWHLPENHQRYSVFINQEDVREMRVNVIEVLRNISVLERQEMRRFIVYELMPRLVYGHSSSRLFRFRDAFHVSMDNLLDLMNNKSEL